MFWSVGAGLVGSNEGRGCDHIFRLRGGLGGGEQVWLDVYAYGFVGI